MWISPAHRPGTQNTEADSFYRNFNEAIEWKLSTHLFQKISSMFGNRILDVLDTLVSFTSSFDSSNLKLAHANIRSCRNNKVEISLFLKENDIYITTLNETWLISRRLDIPYYTITRKDRPRKRGGGVAILERNDVKFDIIDTPSTINNDNQTITILLKNSPDSVSISAIYIPPASTINTTAK